MSIISPNQFECDRMKPGDVIYVKYRNPIYKLIRNLFYKNKPKISVVYDWNMPDKKVKYYQEDCTLVYKYESQCVQVLQNEITCIVSYKNSSKMLKAFKINKLCISLYNIQVTLKNNLSFIIPLMPIEQAIARNKILKDSIDTSDMIFENLKFIRYKGDYFRNYVKKYNISEWVSQYCSICGGKVIFKFNEDVVDIECQCECGDVTLSKSKMTYDEFSMWYASQTSNHIKKYYDKFWFRRE